MTPRTGHAYLDAPTGPLAFAHRGGARHPDLVGLENTLAAFRHAASLGYSYLETDVHATSDGVLLAFHDAVLDRVSDTSGGVADATYAEIRAVRIAGREPIPTLAELFDALPGARFNIDLKSGEAVPLLAQFVAEREAWDRVLVGSFSGRRLRRFRRLTGGRVATSASPLQVVAYRLLPSARLAALLSGGRGFAALQVPHRRGPLTVTTAGLVRRAHRTGKHVHSWTVDDADEMIVLLDRGVDGLMTDRTDILRDVLVQRGQWRGQP
ncbi:glycerophosphodiester phosphodiesterase family protein [Nocardioides euryhalodurans]|uniref:Glycerophosphodiester phosphodiesterase n=1 Tax=Nocardioides euryhalodurans TaxID=2518370 RepID=A0A4P7GHJ4_9ACTN|nr:glycerophosphodiester phosphodiesterase family protein [Nocardioides euryhalodurans]QBR91211.1 glycerophosphodiester phosphodiesterase [Nocardioides euryhalodurans]